MPQKRDERQHGGKDEQGDPGDERGDMQEEVLEAVESYEPALVIRFDNQEKYCRNDGYVSQHAGYIVGHSASRGWHRLRHRSSRAAMRRTNCGTICCLSATH